MTCRGAWRSGRASPALCCTSRLSHRWLTLFTEILARARTAEASVAQQAAERKDLEARVRKAETEATTGLAEATMQRMKAESECDALRDMVKSLKDAWTRDVAGYRAEVERVRDETRTEREQMAQKEAVLTKLVKQHK